MTLCLNGYDQNFVLHTKRGEVQKVAELWEEKSGRLVIDPTLYDQKLILPPIDPLFTPFCAAVLLQLLAYYTSLLRGLERYCNQFYKP